MEERFDKQTQERAVLVGLNADCFAEEDTATESTLDELEDLLETAGGFCTGKVLQNRHTPDSHSFIGEGKAQEVRMLAEATQATMVIFDNELSPGNIRALEEIIGLPVLDRLALFCGSSRFRNLPLHEASAQFTYQESAWHISNILVESENLVRVEGWLEIGKGGALTGRLQVGLRADGLWKALPGFSDVFSVSRQGAGGNLAWANVNIGGTLDNPSEDLSARLIKAAGNRLTEIGMGKAAEVADVAARLLNRGTEKNGAGDGAEHNGRKFRIPAADEVPAPVVPQLQDAAEKGLKTGNDLMNELMNW